RVVVQTDGQLKTGKDIAIATLLGAEEWGIATAALVVEGCIMMRKCHLNTCPVGIATQDKELRKLYNGDADHVVNFFKFVTEELREIMAELGFRTVEEMIGQVDCLEARTDVKHWKYSKLDLSAILYKQPADTTTGLYKQEEQDHGLDTLLDWKLLEAVQPALEHQQKVYASFEIKNTDRTAGTILSNEISKKYRSAGLPDDTIHFKFTGTAGQSFGAFNTNGVTMELEGDANDYFGKGLSGAKLIVYPSANAGLVPEENIIIGNVAFYGATSGTAYIRGKAGERFAVRNSGVQAVVEGVGDHGCEYMTGGCIVVLGDTGRNFAAGMSGGLAYVYDVRGSFRSLCNPEMVDLHEVSDQDYKELRQMIENHFQYTHSTVAKFIIDDFDNQVRNFIKVFPKDYKRVLAATQVTAIESINDNDTSINDSERAA
ncbi:MAG: glutamate synthase-related protein, partial [Bacteroidota bacterium]|nr:glutamate synthase-related protein [Bacteroidota bacterium]